MNWKSAIPNGLTLGNLLMGVLGIIFSFHGEMLWSTYCILLAAVFDFFDGFVARMLGVSGELGKQLDSLADAVTFGVLPGILLFHWISIGLGDYFEPLQDRELSNALKASVALFVPLMAIMRLAIFNIDTRQSDRFIGVPTPAMALIVASFPLIMELQYNLNFYVPINSDIALGTLLHLYPWWGAWDFHLILLLWNPLFMMVLSVVLGVLMVAPLPLLSFKFKNFSWQDNKQRYGFLGLVVFLILLVFLPYLIRIDFMPYLDYTIIPIILLLYIVYSAIAHLISSK